MLIAHVSDTHVTAPGRKAYGVAPVGDLLARTVARINALEPQADLAVLTGDVTFSGRIEEAREAKRLLSALRCPYYVIPGNHDDRESLWEVFGGTACPSRDGAYLSYVVEDFPLRLVALDSTRPGLPGGELCARRADWLRAQLAEQPERRSLLMLHHPPVNFGVLETDEDGFEGQAGLARILAEAPSVERILCGHIHLAAHAAWQGTAISTAPATGMELRLDLTLQKPSAFLLRDPGFLLHYVDGDGPVVSHLVTVSNDDPLYPFEEQGTRDVCQSGPRAIR